MPAKTDQTAPHVILDLEHFPRLLETLTKQGYQLLGPTVRDNAIIYDEISSVIDLPVGWIDQQDQGSYRLTKSDKKALFGYVVGPHAWKKYLYPPVQDLWKARREGHRFEVIEGNGAPGKRAFIGVRACELAAIAVQDKVLLAGPYADPWYKKYRENIFIVAVNCTRAGGNCFCASMNTGPRATGGFDLVLTEMVTTGLHYFVVESGSAAGIQLLQEIPSRKTAPAEAKAAQEAIQQAAEHMGKTLETTGIKELLYRNFDHPRWAEVARRCLTCGNCTMVCPTCFCVTVEDSTDLSRKYAERRRRLDSCFTIDFSYIHGGSVRLSTLSRYRQWMTHKLASWQDQFGTSGCVGCGRCITWCPVGIDLTEEARAIRGSPGKS